MHSTPKDPDKRAAYGKVATTTIAAAGGALVAKSLPAVLAGAHKHAFTAVIELPSCDVATTWVNSDEYQALATLRNEAMVCDFILCGD